jgi:hypothetical protein
VTAEQTSIFGSGRTLVNGKPLTARQQAAFDYIRHAAYGATTVEVGQNWHSLRGKHSDEHVCQWCEKDGIHVLRSKALAELVTRKRATGRFYCRRAEDALVDQAAPAPERPDGRGAIDPSTMDIPF